MKENRTQSLLMAGILFISLSAQSLLLAPHLHFYLAIGQPWWIFLALGTALYSIGLMVAAALVLNYARSARAWVNLVAAISLVFVGWMFYQERLYIEAVAVAALAGAFALSSRLTLSRDWLSETFTLVNLLVGAVLLLNPSALSGLSAYREIEPLQLVFGAVFLLSAIMALLIRFTPSLSKIHPGRFLSVPWLVWGLMFIFPVRFPSLSLVTSLGLALSVGEYVDWEKVSLRQGSNLGKGFFLLLSFIQIISLGMAVWLIESLARVTSRESEILMTARTIALFGHNALSILVGIVLAWVNLSINGLLYGLATRDVTIPRPPETGYNLLDWLLARLLAPFNQARDLLRAFIREHNEQEDTLNRQIAMEKKHMAQLELLHQVNLELEAVLDEPVSAQLCANAIYTALGGNLAAILRMDPERSELVALAASGPAASLLPVGYRQKTSDGILGRTARLRRTQLASDTRLDPDYLSVDSLECLSELVVPLLAQNQVRGVIVLDHPATNAFDGSDIRTLETVAIHLVTAWERSEHDTRLTHLIEAGISLSTTLDVEEMIQEVAKISRQTLDARFIYVALADKGGGFTRTASVGYAPTLLAMLNSDPLGSALMQTVMNSASGLRLRDVRKRFSATLTGSNELRSLLATPIRLRQSSIGAILAFGKVGGLFFSDKDEALGSLLATQAAAAIESAWLYQELRTMLATATHLYQLSIRVIQSEELTAAASTIAESVYQLSKAESAGIVLFNPEKEISARVQIDHSGMQPGSHHPLETIHQAMEDGQTIILSVDEHRALVCMPLQTPRHQYGALWVQVPEKHWASARLTDNLHTLANQAAIALERSLLLAETRKQAEQLEKAFNELETTYDQTLAALTAALDARDRETEGHSMRVARVAHALGMRMGLSVEQGKVMERGAILHDIGKIGISDTILLKAGPLNDDEWHIMRQHPDIGARIIAGIPFLQDAIPVIRYHQERWDGSGYPLGLKKTDIPMMARIFAVVDAFDALTNDRPYRKSIPHQEALAYLKEQAGIHFDPEVVNAFESLVTSGQLP